MFKNPDYSEKTFLHSYFSYILSTDTINQIQHVSSLIYLQYFLYKTPILNVDFYYAWFEHMAYGFPYIMTGRYQFLKEITDDVGM